MSAQDNTRGIQIRDNGFWWRSRYSPSTMYCHIFSTKDIYKLYETANFFPFQINKAFLSILLSMISVWQSLLFQNKRRWVVALERRIEQHTLVKSTTIWEMKSYCVEKQKSLNFMALDMVCFRRYLKLWAKSNRMLTLFARSCLIQLKRPLSAPLLRSQN